MTDERTTLFKEGDTILTKTWKVAICVAMAALLGSGMGLTQVVWSVLVMVGKQIGL
jgi:hypothetical protein